MNHKIIEQQILARVSKITGHSTEDIELDMFLEADLGFDSIKMVELLNGLIQLIPEQQQAEFMEAVPLQNLIQLQTVGEVIRVVENWLVPPAAELVLEISQPVAPQIIVDTQPRQTSDCQNHSSQVKQQILARVSKITGHNPEDIELDMFLEADLGFDSIKMVELLNGLIQLIPESQQAEFMEAVPLQNLIQLQTVGEVIRVVENWLISSEPETNIIENNLSTQLQTIIETPVQKTETVEILDVQTYQLLTHWLIKSNSLCSSLRLQGTFDLKIAWQSWQDLIARHPMLRGHFIIPDGATSFKNYQLVVDENPSIPLIPVTDVRHLDSQAKEKAVNEEFHHWLNYEWELAAWPLHQFSVFWLEDSVYQLFLGNEHLVSDGLGNHIILREFMEIYRAKLAGETPDLPPATTVKDYQELVQKLNAWREPSEEKALREYTLSQGRDAYFWNPQGDRIVSHLPVFQNRQYRLGKDITNQLISRTREWRLPLNSLLLGAFLRAAAKFEQSSQPMIVQIPTSGRVYPGIDAGNIVSDFAQNLALSFERPKADESWQSLLNRIHQEVQKGLVSGCDRAQLHQMAATIKDNIVLDNGKVPETILSIFQGAWKSNLYLPYTGNTHIKKCYGSLEVVDYRAGGMNAVGTIDILQEIFDDSLHIFASYDGKFFAPSLIDSLIAEYMNQLHELAALQIQFSPVTKLVPEIPTQGILSTLRKIVAEISHNHITDADIKKDLEAELGINSLELIRIITQLEKQLGKLDRKALLGCRTILEMADVLSPKTQPQPSLIPLQLPTVTQDKYLLEIPYLQIIKQAQRTPDAVAILEEDRQLTYKQLDLLSNQIANYLRDQGVKPGVLVGMMLGRSSLMFVAVLGILKAGGAYVPLDPSYPDERLRYILENAELKILLTEHKLDAKLTTCLTSELPLQSLLFLDEGRYVANPAWKQVEKNVWSSWSTQEPTLLNNPEDLMTVLYTSGSTGRPKGVMLNHQGYMNRLQWMQDAFQLRPGERVAQKTSCCFDISVWEIFWPLMVGATVCPVETETVKNPWSFAQWLQDTGINIVHFVPSLFGEFLSASATESWSFPHLRWLIFSGEALPAPFIGRWIDQYGMKVGLANLYGPTEASIDVTAHIIRQRPSTQGDQQIPIGKAIANVDILILDEQMQPVAPGQMGELWIGGVQLAKGYLKDPERTAAAFRPNPFSHIPSEFLYRTGDLAIEFPDGSYEYHGRIDHQVKIRGFRVELGEIESVLNSHPAVNEAAVLAVDYGDGQKKLVAYLAGQQVDHQQIKQQLSDRLPNYMIPHRWEWIPSLPKNHNGKLDRKALQAIFDERHLTPSNTKTDTEYLPLAPAQRWLINYFEPPYQWTGYTRFIYHQPLDMDAFNQALNIIVSNHQALCTVFVQQNGQWWQKLINPEKTLLAEFYDGSHLEVAQRDREVHQLIEKIGKELRIDQWPLLKVVVVKVNESAYDMAIIGHHIIGDLLSNNLVFNEFWQVYQQILGNQNPKPVVSQSYTDYLRVLQQAEQQGALASHVEYWRSRFPSQDYSLKIPFDCQKGANTEASAASETFTLNKNDSEILLRRAKQHYGCNLYSILLAPLYELMSEWSGASHVVLSHRSHGRNLNNNQTFFETVGNFAVNFPIGIPVNKKSQWQQKVKEIAAVFNELPMNGVSFDWIADQLPKHVYPDTNLTQVRANYLGNRSVPNSQLFEFKAADRDRRLSPPEEKRTTLLEFFFSINDGILELEVEYSQNFHVAPTIRKLGQRYLELLHDLLGATTQTQVAVTSNGLPPSQPLPQIQRHLPLTGQVAIVTGGSRGIGRAIALKLAEQGARVAIVSRSAKQLEETTALIEQIGGETIAIPTDISDLDQVKQMVEQVVKQFGGVDILVNNAGITGFAPLATSDPAQWRQILEVNVFGTYHCCRSVIPQMNKRGKGKIINLGSDSSIIGYPLFSAYAASKHAIAGMTKSLAEELKQKNIQVNAVCPAFVDTDLTPKVYRPESIPVEQIADVVAFLASPQSNSITGECLKVFGKQDMFFYGSKNMLEPFKNKQ
ncbi:MAG: amino acid adenylation domain-containing protein [Nostoc desertorum CM1-VF14]|jgi:amino acid adenylation domain-containing protein|nr:amino acid adenylation domain-containing protein [Nostoc desertorum CM1-VF14]